MSKWGVYCVNYQGKSLIETFDTEDSAKIAKMIIRGRTPYTSQYDDMYVVESINKERGE